jgi:hypothetical protein
MIVKCDGCDKPGKLGHSLFRHRVYRDEGGRMNVILCTRCEQQVRIVPRKKINLACVEAMENDDE